MMIEFVGGSVDGKIMEVDCPIETNLIAAEGGRYERELPDYIGSRSLFASSDQICIEA